MVAIIFWKSKPWTICYGFDRNMVICYGFDPNRNPDRNPDRNPGRNLCFRKLLWFRSEIATLIETLIETLVETSVPGLRTGFRSGFRFATLNRNLKVLKFATLGGFLWLRSGLRTGLRTGFRLQFRNPETFWNCGDDDQVLTRVAIRFSIRVAIATLVVYFFIALSYYHTLHSLRKVVSRTVIYRFLPFFSFFHTYYISPNYYKNNKFVYKIT